mmetsp:Transcript_906/g.1693  ORF Transcript_906/g.1693 Transcript_906/m.1693 type:complete len:211 (+) Transcript_906:115-747(+)
MRQNLIPKVPHALGFQHLASNIRTLTRLKHKGLEQSPCSHAGPDQFALIFRIELVSRSIFILLISLDIVHSLPLHSNSHEPNITFDCFGSSFTNDACHARMLTFQDSSGNVVLSCIQFHLGTVIGVRHVLYPKECNSHTFCSVFFELASTLFRTLFLCQPFSLIAFQVCLLSCLHLFCHFAFHLTRIDKGLIPHDLNEILERQTRFRWWN